MNAADIVRSAQVAEGDDAIGPWRALMLTLLRYLGDVDMPPELEPPRLIAEAFWGSAEQSEADLLRAKELTWAYLESFPPGEDLRDRSGRLARAVLCVLEPDGDDEAISMTAEWFAAMTSEES